MPTTHDNTTTQRDVFELAISAWGERITCEMTTKAGASCRRPAHWRANLHGCEQGLMCGQHMNAWTRHVMHQMRFHGPARCTLCHRVFESLAAACRITAL